MKNLVLVRVSIGFSLFIVISIAYHYQHEISDAIILRFKVGATGSVCEARFNEGKNQGYIIGWDFNEGQTCASRNLLGLLHWASTMNSTVVEPCTYNSFFKMFYCFNATSNEDPFYFRDYFDVDYWNKQVLSHQFGRPMVPWKDFITDVPCKAIIVYLWKQRGAGQPTTFVSGNIITEDAANCISHSLTPSPSFTKNMHMLNKLDTKIVREVCIKFDPFKAMNVQWFNEQILGDYKPSSVMILLTAWPGLFHGNVFFSNKALRHTTAFDFLKVSQRVIADSRKYKEQFLRDSYIAVQLRMIKIAIILREKHVPSATIVQYITVDCPNELSSVLEKINGTRMLALDLGRFGDKDAFDVTDDTANKIVPKLVNIVYGNKWNWTEWEDSFVQATGGIVDRGYIALVQKTLVINAACIITAGPTGQFQNSMLREYKARVKHPCIYQVCAKYYT